jgi:hypothetical protein
MYAHAPNAESTTLRKDVKRSFHCYLKSIALPLGSIVCVGARGDRTRPLKSAETSARDIERPIRGQDNMTSIFCEFLRISANFCEFLRISANFCEFLRFSAIFGEFLRFSANFNKKVSFFFNTNAVINFYSQKAEFLFKIANFFG